MNYSYIRRLVQAGHCALYNHRPRCWRAHAIIPQKDDVWTRHCGVRRRMNIILNYYTGVHVRVCACVCTFPGGYANALWFFSHWLALLRHRDDSKEAAAIHLALPHITGSIAMWAFWRAAMYEISTPCWHISDDLKGVCHAITAASVLQWPRCWERSCSWQLCDDSDGPCSLSMMMNCRNIRHAKRKGFVRALNYHRYIGLCS